MIILGIETSCDETAAAVVEISASGKPSADKGVTILSNVVASSAKLQAKYGGVIPEQAAREQIKSIIPVIEETLNHAFPNVILRPKAEESLAYARPTFVGDPSLIVQDDRVRKIDAIAVTYGPGLIGSLLVGVETAKTLAMVWNKPLIPVNHLIGHFYANWITHQSSLRDHEVAKQSSTSNGEIATSPAKRRGPRNDNFQTPAFPCIGLLVSGGHTDLVLFTDHGKYQYLGGTRDDAAGECFDKCARLLGLSYPGGPAIARLAESAKPHQRRAKRAKLAKSGNPNAFDLPRPMIDSKDFDFSFSGLKTAVANLLHTSPVILSEAKNLSLASLSRRSHAKGGRSGRMRDTSNELRDPSVVSLTQDDNTLADLAASIEQAIVDVLVAKTVKAAQMYKVDQIMIAGGVAANQSLIRNFKFQISNFKLKIRLYVPPAELCTDNAAMIASAAFFNYQPINPLVLQANPNLNL